MNWSTLQLSNFRLYGGACKLTRLVDYLCLHLILADVVFLNFFAMFHTIQNRCILIL